MPKTKQNTTHARKKPKAFYSQKPPPVATQRSEARPIHPPSSILDPLADLPHATALAPSHFTLREDGSIDAEPAKRTERSVTSPSPLQSGGEGRDEEAIRAQGENFPSSTLDPRPSAVPKLVFHDESHRLWLYQGNCLELLDAIHAKYPEGRFDMIFADPPYFLSNGGITCHAGKMVKVDKGDWDKSRGPELNHEFNKEWLMRCQRVLKPNGTIWVSGTHHVIFSIGYAMQELGFKILNDIAWEKPNPPPGSQIKNSGHHR